MGTPPVTLIVVTDSYYEFVAPFMPKLNYVTLFAHRLEVAPNGEITGYRLRVQDNKRRTVLALRDLGFRTIAVGDSFNDVAMLEVADSGVLFRPPASLPASYPALNVASSYVELQGLVAEFVQRSEVFVASVVRCNMAERLSHPDNSERLAAPPETSAERFDAVWGSVASPAGYILAVSYPVLALSTGARAAYQLAVRDDITNYVPVLMSGLAALCYLIAAIGFAYRRPAWWWVSIIALTFEMLMVLVVEPGAS